MSRRFDSYMILTRSNPRQVFLQASGQGQGYTVPEWEPDSNVWVQLEARETNNFATKQLGLPVTLLEVQPGALFKSNGRRAKAYFLEGHDPTWQAPEGSIWTGLSDLEAVNLAVPELKPLIQNWLAGPLPAEPGEPPAPGWIYPGWLDEVEDWVKEQLAGQSVRLIGRLEQLKSWSISCVLRFPTDHGDYFFKATPQVFKQEPYFTAFLAENYPDIMPRLSVIDSERGWMLMPDFKAKEIRDNDDIRLWEEAARRFAQFQVSSLGLTKTLLERGIRDRRLERLGAQLEAVANDTPRLTPNPETSLTLEELEKLRALVPIIKAQIDDLAAFGLPASIIHGDLNPNNIALTETGDLIYYDWTDVIISHPFFDLDAMLEWGSPFEKAIPDWQKRVRNAYLEAWNGYLPMPELVRAFELAAPLAMLVQALNYHSIVTRTEKSGRWEWENTVPYYFRRLLESQGEKATQ